MPFASLDKGMGIGTRDGDFSVGVHFLLQARWEHTERLHPDGRDDGFKIMLARPALRGTAFRKWVTYFVQFELAGSNATLLDAQVNVQPIPELGIQVGQFLTPFSREFLDTPGMLLFPEFAPSNTFLRTGRDVGALLTGRLLDKRLEYWAGPVNGNGIDRPLGGLENDNAQLEWMGRLQANVMGAAPYTEIPQLVTDAMGLVFGINGAYGDTEQTTSTLDPKTGAVTATKIGSSPTTRFGADARFNVGPFSLQVEGYSRTIQAVGGGARKVARGGFAQAGVFVYPRRLELAVRGDLIDVDAAHDNPLDKRIDAAVSYHFDGNHLKLQLRYAHADSPNALAPSPKGISNDVTLQGQLWF